MAALLLAAAGSAAVALASCRSSRETASPRAAVGEPSAVHIRWLPPAVAAHQSIFADAAARHGVDADVLAIVALIESGGDPGALSPAGAVGLMQIMPGTAQKIAAARGLSPAPALGDPATNVDYGAWYFAQQLDTFGEGEAPGRALELASAAYNAGPRAVSAFVGGAGPLPEETERYKALVVSLWEERAEEASPAYESWRGRVRKRLSEKAVSPVPGARVTLRHGEKLPDGAAHHTGVDLAQPEGTAVLAPLDGTVVTAGRDGDRGEVVVLRHKGGLETRYHHLGRIDVRAGEKVTARTPIGAVGVTGKTTGPHVHFEVRDLGAPIDPAPFVAEDTTP